MDIGIFEVLVSLGILFLILRYYSTLNFDFWKKRNVSGPKPIAFFGNYKEFFFGKLHLGLLIKKYYDEFKDEPIIGLFIRSSPVLIVKDPDLIKDVLIRDFHIFCDRGIYVSKKDDPLHQHLVNLEYNRWRPLRNKLSPVFTSGKLREMFYLMINCADHFEKHVEKIIEKNQPIECRELSAKFTIQSIGVCAFGLNTNALDDNSEFRKHGRDLFDTNFMNVLKFMLREFSPSLYEMLGPFKISNAMKFFIKSMKETMEYRRNNEQRRNDFVDLLMDLQRNPEKISNIDFSDLFLIGQALVFFAAGFETSSTTMSNAFYELALNPNIQNRLRQEIREELKQNKGELTYDSIKRMQYLDKVVKETLRKYPPGSILRRKTSDSYTFSNIKVSIPKGTQVIIPVWAIQRDSLIYPNPDVFDPERFNEEIEKHRHPMHYLPFGDGPHNCIGSRFANYQTKIGIISLINKFKVDACNKTCMTYTLNPRSIISSPIGGIYLMISKA